ncbi:uncharacterized protein LY89DRAFT_25815 [Mollisia scopiformis]|uniref:Zn(2)-C6 fungal-type domain-containing protein n=1 Tax=Mollisia scopiformis TaxID=149040 RepID=A0A194XWV0_MOLSC|nr:uncharacterized protein LY89DRAFT_25815 [Mollisia scopiformis]KUJ24626.1 hypothetical protein LY89DRAFT_25815 [Mollisia scopiformis]
MATSRGQSRKVRTACDRCYELKERCTRTSITIECKRCQRLDIICSTVRPVKRAGRRPQHRKQSLLRTTPSCQSSNAAADAVNIAMWLQSVSDLNQKEKELLTFLLGRPETLDCYVVGSSFQAAEQRSLMAPLPAALPVLKDAYLAYAGALKLSQPSNVTEVDKEIGLRYASSAMTTLMSLPVATFQDANLCLTLGTVLALYVYSAVGVGMADICHYCLSTTSSFIKTAGSDTEMDSWQSFLVLLEIMDCVVHRRRPTLRIQVQTLESVDRHLGLCVPLLPYYYDLCVISHTLRSSADTSYSVHIQKQLDGIHQAIEEWQPSHGDLVDKFEAAEVVNLLAQAKVYRLAGLLISHRLRYVFGQQDRQADTWSKEIMMELELARKFTKQSIRCVTMPFIAAAIEIRDPSARLKALKNVDEYVDQFTPVVQEATRTFLERVWHERDVKITTCWFDSLSKPCVVLNSIDAACFG